MLRQRIDETMSQSRRSGQKVAVVCLDLDDFKSVNETLGHATGDKVLRGVAKRLRSSLRQEDLVGRLGADEFIVVQSGILRPGGSIRPRPPAAIRGDRAVSDRGPDRCD